MRCFVAVDPPADARDALARVQATLRDAGPRADVRWTAPGSLHLTLTFLGETALEAQPAIVAALTAVATRHPAFALSAVGVGAFPGLERPRVVWVGLADGLREMGRLAADVERALVPLGFPLGARPFSGHVTLGRVRSPRGLRPLIDAARVLEARPVASWRVDEIVLYRSELRPGGAVYEALARVRLA